MPQDDIAVLLVRFLEEFLQVFRQTVAPWQRVIPRLGVAVEPHLEVDGLFFAEAGAQHRDLIDMAAQPLVIRRFRAAQHLRHLQKPDRHDQKRNDKSVDPNLGLTRRPGGNPGQDRSQLHNGHDQKR